MSKTIDEICGKHSDEYLKGYAEAIHDVLVAVSRDFDESRDLIAETGNVILDYLEGPRDEQKEMRT